jgi:hypothetical protein
MSIIALYVREGGEGGFISLLKVARIVKKDRGFELRGWDTMAIHHFRIELGMQCHV